ncbi:invasion associated locus B family protein [Roseovarius sp. SCSIO 43702]|uniref:invasion associated locus B family protein n=1 Tax=Roseovarius sp. SCSIO 43702 TaxID=2823043 RepID=UPI001C739F15|nr:invasion associated locus B family protein [Roseovarius sp. SCSIO 43702]QYX57143.1 invasion associated locus B family protein [Roseovarius sp. SCSIO 43702]
MMKKLFLAAALAATTPFAAMAQDTTEGVAESELEAARAVANNSVFGGWIVNCEALTVRDTSCRLIQQLTLAESGALVARFIVLPVEDGAAVMLAQVPMGVFLPGGAVFRVEGADDDAQKEMIWQRCLGELCEAAIRLEGEDIDALREADAMLFGYRIEVDGDPVVVRVDTSEFGAAIDAIREDAETEPAAE